MGEIDPAQQRRIEDIARQATQPKVNALFDASRTNHILSEITSAANQEKLEEADASKKLSENRRVEAQMENKVFAGSQIDDARATEEIRLSQGTTLATAWRSSTSS